MLDTISNDVKKHYYDPKLHGIDWDANVKRCRERIDNASSLNRGLSEVAAALDVLNDHIHSLSRPRVRISMTMVGRSVWSVKSVLFSPFVLWAMRPQRE